MIGIKALKISVEVLNQLELDEENGHTWSPDFWSIFVHMNFCLLSLFVSINFSPENPPIEHFNETWHNAF